MGTKKNTIITLTTDFGLSDPYVAAMKGVIFSINPSTTIIDITHNIPPQDILAANLVLHSSLKYFPLGSIHVAVVDPGVGGARKAIVARKGRNSFIGPDNGIFSGFIDSANVREISEPKFMLKDVSNTFHGRDIFAPAAAHLSKGVRLDRFGPKVKKPEIISMPEPKVEGTKITGEVIYVDRFGNLVTNIPGDYLKHGSSKVITIRRKNIRHIVNSYAEAKHGELVGIIGSFGLVEISASMSSAAEKTGAGKGDKATLKT